MKFYFVLFAAMTVCYQPALHAQEKNENTWLNSAAVKLEEGDTQGAVAVLTKAIELKPNDAAAYNIRGSAKVILKDYQGAAADFSKAIDLKPDLVTAYFGRGGAKFFLDDYQGAVADIIKGGYAYIRNGIFN